MGAPAEEGLVDVEAVGPSPPGDLHLAAAAEAHKLSRERDAVHRLIENLVTDPFFGRDITASGQEEKSRPFSVPKQSSPVHGHLPAQEISSSANRWLMP